MMSEVAHVSGLGAVDIRSLAKRGQPIAMRRLSSTLDVLEASAQLASPVFSQLQVLQFDHPAFTDEQRKKLERLKAKRPDLAIRFGRKP